MTRHSEEDPKKSKVKIKQGAEEKGHGENEPIECIDAETTVTEKDLQARLTEKEKEAAANYDKYVRAVAELDNYKKIAAREKSDVIKYANENILKDILPILDNLDRALDHAAKGQDTESLTEGLRIIRGQLMSALEKYGVTGIESVNNEFDPNIHESLQRIQITEGEDNKVVEEFEKGYLLHNRLLRPAKVSVSKCIDKKEE